MPGRATEPTNFTGDQMPKSSAIRQIATVLTLLFAGSFPALSQSVQSPQADSGSSYSATAFQQLPGQAETSGKVIKSGQNMRLEFEQNGQKVIQILRPTDGVMYVLNPANKSYFEVRGPAVPATATDGYTTPCPDAAASDSCKRTGTDTISGIAVERWELALQPGTPPLVLFWDSTRRRALRQEFPDGSVMAMRFKAMEEINGRQTEHWIIEITAPGQPVNSGNWWFDPELRLVVREELPGGELRHLEDISTGAIDPALFVVPQGWTRQQPPAQSAQPSNPPANQ